MPTTFVLVAVAMAPAVAFGFGSKTHRGITSIAVSLALDDVDEVVVCPQSADLQSFLRFLHGEVASAGTSDAKEFARRWPRPEMFDAFEAKGFLDLARGARVVGLDHLPCDDHETAHDLVVRESVRPDEDGRNISRKAYGADRKPIEAGLGPVPEDPIVLDMGGLDGLASQAHAHYLLAEDPGGWLARGEVASRLSSAPLDLWRNPAHFAVATAVPGGPFTLGADMAMEHFLLALMAASWPEVAARRLSLGFLGHALHYVQDASDPLHTVQVGHACVVLHGVLAFASRALTTAGGYVGTLQGPTSVISDMVSNLHLWTEAFWDEMGAVPPGAGWPRVWSTVARATNGDLKGALLTAWRASEAVRWYGPPLYEAACRAVSPRVLTYGTVLKDGEIDALAILHDRQAGLKVERIGRGAALVALAESAVMVRAYANLAPLMNDPEERRKVAALLATRMRAVTQREARLAAWQEANPNAAVPASDPARFPLVLALELVVLLLALIGALRLLARARGQSHSPGAQPR